MDILFESYNNDLNQLNLNLINNLKEIIDIKNKKINTQLDEINELNKQLSIIKDKCINLTEECENYQKVSIVKNLHNQIFEKDNTITILTKKLNKFNNSNIKLDIIDVEPSNKINSKVEEDDEEEVDEVEVGEEEVEVEEEDGEEEDAEVEDGEEEDAEEEVEEEEEEVEVEEEEEEVEEEDAEEEVEVEDGEEEVEEEEEDGEEEVEEEDGEEEVEEIYFYEKRLKPPNGKGRLIYLITDDEIKDIYEKLDNGEPGKHIGKLIGKQNKPFFFK